MKYSNIIGVLAAAVLIYSCTLPWITLPQHNITVGGFFHSEKFDLFGHPGKLQAFLCGVAIILFLIPRLWAKRVNVFVCALGVAFASANFYRIGVICRDGDCPQRQPGIYIMLFAAIIVFIMCLLPKLEIKVKKSE